MPSSRTYAERCELIQAIAETDYDRKSDTAAAYLSAVEGADSEEQVRLFTEVIRQHGARSQWRRPPAAVKSMKDKTWKVSAERMADTVSSWVRSALLANRSPEETARTVWNQLTLHEAADRCAALGLFLASEAVPYAQLPGDLLVRQPPDVYRAARHQILNEVALLRRAFHQAQDSTECAEALARILLTLPSDRTLCAVLIEELVERATEGMARKAAKLMSSISEHRAEAVKEGAHPVDPAELPSHVRQALRQCLAQLTEELDSADQASDFSEEEEDES